MAAGRKGRSQAGWYAVSTGQSCCSEAIVQKQRPREKRNPVLIVPVAIWNLAQRINT